MCIRDRSQLVQELRDYLSPLERPWVERAVRLMPTLSPREEDVVRRLAASHNTQGIIETLGISQKTVEHHVSNLYDKLGLSDADTTAPTLRKATPVSYTHLATVVRYQSLAPWS